MNVLGIEIRTTYKVSQYIQNSLVACKKVNVRDPKTNKLQV